MNTRKHLVQGSMLLLAVLALAACGGELAPTAPVPPTDVSVAAVQPSATPVSPTAPPKPKLGRIVFTSNRVSWDDIYVMNENGTDARQLTKMGKCYNGHFTPDSKTIVFNHAGDIWKMNADGSGQTNLTNTTDNVEGWPVVAPDGSRIAYLFGSAAGAEIYTMNLDGTDRQAVTTETRTRCPRGPPTAKRSRFCRCAAGGSTSGWSIATARTSPR